MFKSIQLLGIYILKTQKYEMKDNLLWIWSMTLFTKSLFLANELKATFQLKPANIYVIGVILDHVNEEKNIDLNQLKYRLLPWSHIVWATKRGLYLFLEKSTTFKQLCPTHSLAETK